MQAKILPMQDSPVFRRNLAAILRSGKAVMMPTDTIYGLSCRADKATAVAKIFSLKERDKNKPLLVLVSSLSMAKRFCRINRLQAEALKNIWKQARPTSVLLLHRGLLPANLTAGSPYLAVRLPKSIFLRKIVRALGSPLVSSSANLSGREVLDARRASEVFAGKKELALIISGGTDKKAASRLLLMEADGSYKILRR